MEKGEDEEVGEPWSEEGGSVCDSRGRRGGESLVRGVEGEEDGESSGVSILVGRKVWERGRGLGKERRCGAYVNVLGMKSKNMFDGAGAGAGAGAVRMCVGMVVSLLLNLIVATPRRCELDTPQILSHASERTRSHLSKADVIKSHCCTRSHASTYVHT